MGTYFLIGLIYAMINIVVRKDMNEHQDPWLPVAWVLAWWVFFIPLVITFFTKKETT